MQNHASRLTWRASARERVDTTPGILLGSAVPRTRRNWCKRWGFGGRTLWLAVPAARERCAVRLHEMKQPSLFLSRSSVSILHINLGISRSYLPISFPFNHGVGNRSSSVFPPPLSPSALPRKRRRQTRILPRRNMRTSKHHQPVSQCPRQYMPRHPGRPRHRRPSSTCLPVRNPDVQDVPRHLMRQSRRHGPSVRQLLFRWAQRRSRHRFRVRWSSCNGYIVGTRRFLNHPSRSGHN